MDKRARRLALLEAGAEPLGTSSPCADCGTPRTALNTSVCWSDAAHTRTSRSTFQSAVCDPFCSVRACKRLHNEPAAKLVQMGADAAAHNRWPQYAGEQFVAATELC